MTENLYEAIELIELPCIRIIRDNWGESGRKKFKVRLSTIVFAKSIQYIVQVLQKGRRICTNKYKSFTQSSSFRNWKTFYTQLSKAYFQANNKCSSNSVICIIDYNLCLILFSFFFLFGCYCCSSHQRTYIKLLKSQHKS